LSTLKTNQRNNSRQQTFYSAFAYIRSNDTWARYAVKVFDQSFNGVRMRAMHDLTGDDVYVQLDMTSPVLTLCEIRRRNAVARNCWEFGMELRGVIEIQNAIPREIIERFCDAGTSQHVEAITEPATSPVDELADLLTNQLGLESPKAAPVDEAPEPATPVPEVQPEPVSVEPPTHVEVEVPADEVIEEVVGENSIAASEANEASAPEVEPPGIEPTSELATVEATTAEPSLEPEDVYEEATKLPDQATPTPATCDAPVVQFHSRFEQPAVEPEKQRPSFVKTVLIGFTGLGALLTGGVVRLAQGFIAAIGKVRLPKVSVFSGKTEAQKRQDWLQTCAQTVNPPSINK
jgi:hypothetical protein